MPGGAEHAVVADAIAAALVHERAEYEKLRTLYVETAARTDASLREWKAARSSWESALHRATTDNAQLVAANRALEHHAAGLSHALHDMQTQLGVRDAQLHDLREVRSALRRTILRDRQERDEQSMQERRELRETRARAEASVEQLRRVVAFARALQEEVVQRRGDEKGCDALRRTFEESLAGTVRALHRVRLDLRAAVRMQADVVSFEEEAQRLRAELQRARAFRTAALETVRDLRERLDARDADLGVVCAVMFGTRGEGGRVKSPPQSPRHAQVREG
jgi:chromosome segregation ATPase